MILIDLKNCRKNFGMFKFQMLYQDLIYENDGKWRENSEFLTIKTKLCHKEVTVILFFLVYSKIQQLTNRYSPQTKWCSCWRLWLGRNHLYNTRQGLHLHEPLLHFKAAQYWQALKYKREHRYKLVVRTISNVKDFHISVATGRDLF